MHQLRYSVSTLIYFDWLHQFALTQDNFSPLVRILRNNSIVYVHYALAMLNTILRCFKIYIPFSVCTYGLWVIGRIRLVKNENSSHSDQLQ